jgi:hypothetical protein
LDDLRVVVRYDQAFFNSPYKKNILDLLNRPLATHTSMARTGFGWARHGAPRTKMHAYTLQITFAQDLCVVAAETDAERSDRIA